MARQKGRMRRELRPIYLAVMAGLAASGGAHAQEAIFADDFSVDSLRWVTQSFDGSGLPMQPPWSHFRLHCLIPRLMVER